LSVALSLSVEAGVSCATRVVVSASAIFFVAAFIIFGPMPFDCCNNANGLDRP